MFTYEINSKLYLYKYFKKEWMTDRSLSTFNK